MPILCSYMGLTDQEYVKRKKEKFRSKTQNRLSNKSGINTPSIRSERENDKKIGSLINEKIDERFSE